MLPSYKTQKEAGHFVVVGVGHDPKPAKGPHRTKNDARAAFRRFSERYGQHASTYQATGQLRVYEYRTHRQACAADISHDIGEAGRIA